MERLALDLVDDVIAVSSEDKELMLKMGIEPSKISIVPHGVNGQDIRDAFSRREFWREQYSLEEKVIVFFHGTLHYGQILMPCDLSLQKLYHCSIHQSFLTWYL